MVVEKYIPKRRKFYAAFMDLENAMMNWTGIHCESY